MKRTIVMKLKSIGIVARQRKIHAVSKALLGAVLAVVALPCLLSAQTTLQHRYSFVSDASDSVGGSAWNGTINGPNGGSSVTFSNGLVLPGGGGPGYSGYVTLPAGILNTTTSVTVEFWATQNTANGWAEVWSFNSGTPSYWAFISDGENNNNNVEQALRLNNNETDSQAGVGMPGSETHYTVTYNASTLVDTIWQGQGVIANATAPNSSYAPATQSFSSCLIGQDPWSDPQWQGTLNEFRIYNGVLSPLQITVDDAAGPTNLVTSLTPISAVTLPGSTNLVLTGSAQAIVDATFTSTGTNVIASVAPYATNWVSSNPNAVQVSSSGVITGVGIGNATVSSTFNGVTSTTPTIFVTGPQALVHRYSFATDASDSVGGPAWAGTIVAPNGGTNASIAGGLFLSGGGGPGYSGYLTLPSGILTNTTSVTIECWASQYNGNTWAQLFDFGNSQSQNFGLIPMPGRDNGNLEQGVNPAGNEIDTISSEHFPTNTEQYVAFVFNSSKLTSGLYVNGNLLGTQTFPNRTYIPGSIGGAAGTTNNVFGQDPFPDPQFQGTVYEFRIWNGAVTPVYLEVSAAAGPSVVVTNFTPTSLTLTVTNLSLIGSQTEQASVTGDFTEASGVIVTSGATNWISSNPSVLTVNQSGLITAVSGGTATVSATVSGVITTSATITVATTPPIITQKPVNVTAAVNDTVNFSVSGIGGSLSYQWSFGGNPIAGATGSTLTVTNVAYSSAGTYSVLVSNTAGTTNLPAALTVVQAILEHRYSFASDASDSVGGAQWSGTIVTPSGGTAATISSGLTLPGGGSGGYSGYVAFPTGILTNTTSLTVECWVTQNSAQQWATIWDFANNGNQNFEMCPFPQRGILNLDVAVTPNGGEVDTVTGNLFPSGTEEYTAFTFNAGTLTGSVYTNGALGAVQAYPNSTYIPGTIGGSAGTSQNWLGRDTYNDSQFQGKVYEFRIWDGAVSPLYLAVSEAAGPSVVVSDLTPTSVSVSVTNYTMVQGLSQPASAVGNFTAASGINVTSSATNWISSNTGVLTVNASGQITAVGTGSATISATVNGVTGTSTSISVPSSPPVITQQPATNDTFLQGGTLIASVSNIGTPPFVYRWFFNGGLTPISTSASPALSIPDLQPGNAGTYSVLVSNLDGSILSSNLVVSVMATNAYQQAILQYGPVAYWPLQEASGTIAYDVIGGDNGVYTTTSLSGSSVALGQPGPSQTFFGNSSSAVEFISAIADIPVGQLNITGPITITTWVQVYEAAQFASVVGHGDNSWRISITENGAPGDAIPGANDGTSAAADANAPGSDNINDANWHMLTYTYSGNPNQANNGLLYQDGVLVASNSITAAPVGDNLDVWIGGSPDYGTGRLLTDTVIAHVAVFNQALTSAQVNGLYNGSYVLGPQTLHIAPAGSSAVLTWQAGTLLQSTNILGPWTTNSLATSPYTVPETNKASFFRLMVNP
ncbi:MAG TPA: LamG-like jellyroll fold domain-containing protein [Verrucomicrobiae bacterium]